MRPGGNAWPELVSADRTRSRASRIALSARPTMVNAGSPVLRMSASTHTRRASTPSMAKVTTRAIMTGVPIREFGGKAGGCRAVPAGARHPRACRWHVTGCRVPAGAGRRRRVPPKSGIGTLEHVLEVVEPDEAAVFVERDADGVEPQLGVERPVDRAVQPRRGDRADLLALALVEVLAPVAVPEPARLDLAEDDRPLGLVGEDQVELAPAGAVVAREDAVAEAHEMLRGELLPAPAQRFRAVRRHRGPTVWPRGE